MLRIRFDRGAGRIGADGRIAAERASYLIALPALKAGATTGPRTR